LSSLNSAERANYVDNCLRVQESERLKLGRELHDSTGQLLLALRLEIARLRRANGTSAEGSLLDEIDQTAREIDREIRAFAFTHYPAEIGHDGLGPALRSLARGFASRTGLRIRFSSLPDPTTRTAQIALALLRVAQEALLNVHRHARAAHVQMALKLREGMLELTVKDDGVGIPLAQDLEESHGVGLQGMRHRIERLGGHFAIRRLKHGTKIIAAVPA
jgi:signal transduction histidine kinase